MEKTPLSMRKHIAIIGKTNAGKSTLFNHLLGQNTAIVSSVEGTTTDPNTKAMELIPFGPVALIDTAGLEDQTLLGEKRMEKTYRILKRCDLLLYLIDATKPIEKLDLDLKVPIIRVFTKCDLLSAEGYERLTEREKNAVFIGRSDSGYTTLKNRMVTELNKQSEEAQTLVGDLLPEHSTVLLVTPIDEAAPKGRMILPQMQVLRDCLDHNMKVVVTKENTLKEVLCELRTIDLVITDSQVFSLVDQILPSDLPLTSFSMLLARQKGNFEEMLAGVQTIDQLEDGAKILIMEGCTHNITHSDIGRNKIPSLLRKKTHKTFQYDHYTGYQFPEHIEEYALVISCGMCMVNRREVQSRLKICREHHIPMTNYGMVLAYTSGILKRAAEIFGETK